MLEKGTRVRVSDGTEEPPKHHKKKHRLWLMNNFDGYVYRHDQFGVTVAKNINDMVVFTFREDRVTVLKELPK